MASEPVRSTAVVAAPKDYSIPVTQQIRLLSVRASFDGSGSGSSWIPALQILDNNGNVLVTASDPLVNVAATGSADVSWFPGVKTASGTGGGLALLSRTVLAVDTPSITISGIPATHTHIELYSLTRTDRAAGSDLIALQFNGDTGNNYDWEQLFGNNGVADAFNAPAGGHIAGPISQIALTSATANTATAGSYGSGRWTVLYYTQTATHKMVVGQGGVFVDDSAAGAVRAGMAGVWRNTAAITSMKLFPALGTNFKAGSRFELYGI